MMEDIQFGEVGPHGEILVDTDTCAITGRRIEVGDAMVNLPGGRYFYRVSADAIRLLTPEKRREIEKQAPHTTAQRAASRAEAKRMAEPTEPPSMAEQIAEAQREADAQTHEGVGG